MKFIILEKQEKQLAALLREEVYNEPTPQNPSMKKANKPYCINPDKVLLVKKFLDKGFTPHDWEKVGANGLPMKVKIFSMNASNGEPLKWMYQDQLHDLLVDHFQNMFSDHDERDLFMKQVLKDWINGAIGVHGTLTTNFLKEGVINEITSNDLTAEANNADTDPSDAQKEAGNYKMGHVSIKGMKISIENPQGSYRKYKDENGNDGKNLMKHHYGYFNVTKGKDGDAVDVFIGPDIEDFDKVFCVDQKKKSGEFDETKVMLGFNSKEAAKEAYLSNYSPDWKGFMGITGVSLKIFKKWLYRGRKQRQPFAQYVYIQKKKLDESKLNESPKPLGFKHIDTLWDEESAQNLINRINNIMGGYDFWAEINPRNPKEVVVNGEIDDSEPWSFIEEKIQQAKEIANQFKKEESESQYRQPMRSYQPAYAVNEGLEDFSLRDLYYNCVDNNPLAINHNKKEEPAFDRWKRVRKKSNHTMNLQNSKTGEFISNEWFDWIGYLVNGAAIVMHDNEYNLINEKGELLLPEWHEDIWDNEDGTYKLIDGDSENTISLD